MGVTFSGKKSVTYRMKEETQDVFQNLTLRLGGFHQLMSFLGSGCKLSMPETHSPKWWNEMRAQRRMSITGKGYTFVPTNDQKQEISDDIDKDGATDTRLSANSPSLGRSLRLFHFTKIPSAEIEISVFWPSSKNYLLGSSRSASRPISGLLPG